MSSDPYNPPPQSHRYISFQIFCKTFLILRFSFLNTNLPQSIFSANFNYSLKHVNLTSLSRRIK